MINITKISKRMMQGGLLLMLFMAQSLTSFAEVKLYMEDFTIASEETKEVALLLTNDQAATALQATIELPAGLKYVDNSVAKTSRVKGRGAVVQASIETGPLVIVETDGNIAAGEGAIITFKVEASNNLNDETLPLKITEIYVSDADANPLINNGTYTANVKMLGLDCKFSAPESFEIAANQEYQVDVTMTNVQTLTALQGTLTLPEGLELVVPDEEEPKELFIYSDRIPLQSQFNFQKIEGGYNFVLSSSLNFEIVGNDGVIFSFKVKANPTLAETTEIKLDDLRVATTTGKSQLCDSVTISVTNTSVADKAAFETYKAGQITAVKALAAEGDSEAAQAIITDAVETLEALDFDYDKTLAENKAAVDEIVEPVADALAAQRAADQLAADKAAFDEYKTEQVAAVEALAEEGDSEEAQAIITDAVAAIEALEYNEEKTLEENEAAVDALVEPVADALAEQRAADQLAADKAAFDEYKADLIAAVEALAEEGDSEEAQAIIADAKAAIEALEYDEEKTLEENEAAVDALVEPVADALAEQRAADQLAADKAAFDEYKTDQIAAVEALAAEGDSEAAQAIIADAKAAIEALEYDEEKSLEENEAEVDALVEPVADALAEQRAADQLAADKAAFDEYKADLIAAVEALAEEGDSEASQAIIADAVAAIEALEYDEEKSLEENKAAAEELTDGVAEALAEQRAADQLAADKAEFDEYKADLIAAVEALAEEGDSEASQQIIADAVAAIEALEYDEEKSLEENKAAAEELTDGVAEALDEQRAADAIIMGDVNGDGKINTVDASYILMYLVGNTPADFVEAAADVDGNGIINTLDATAILKMLVQ